MTLVEVLASLALLGTLLGAAVVAQARLSLQWHTAEQRTSAIAALDIQIEAWYAEPQDAQKSSEAEALNAARDESITSQSLPISGEGPLSIYPWWWRAETIEDQPGIDLGIYLIRYTAFDPASQERLPVAAIDVFRYVSLPLEPSKEQPSRESASSTQELETSTPPRINSTRSSLNPGAIQ